MSWCCFFFKLLLYLTVFQVNYYWNTDIWNIGLFCCCCLKGGISQKEAYLVMPNLHYMVWVTETFKLCKFKLNSCESD